MSNPLLGTWCLQSWTINYANSDRVSEPFGAKPEGIIVYTAAGWMNAAICRSGRDLFPEKKALRLLPADQLASAYTSYFHYAGPYRIEGQSVIHTVAMSLNPNFVGSEQVRQFVFDGDQLTLSGEETIDGQLRLHYLVWQRAADIL